MPMDMDKGEMPDEMLGEMPPPPADEMEAKKGDETMEIALPPENFPKGMEPKKGDKCTFCVTSVDSSGNRMGYFEPMEEKEPEESWEDGFKKHMSPANPESEAA